MITINKESLLYSTVGKKLLVYNKFPFSDSEKINYQQITDHSYPLLILFLLYAKLFSKLYNIGIKMSSSRKASHSGSWYTDNGKLGRIFSF